MPLWWDMLATPMAAPETGALRRMRRTWQILCVATALLVGSFGKLEHIHGKLAAALAAGLVVATLLYTALYLSRKKRADDRYLEQLGRAE
jgi:hypothetical protein